MKKRILSITLALCLCVALLPTSAMATSKTADEAIQWAKSQVGSSVGYDDGSGYYQCVEFIQAYYRWLGVDEVKGSGKDYATNALPSGWTRTAGGKPQKGDILIYSRYSADIQPNGHVAIYESDNSLYDQDGTVWHATVKNESANYKTYTYNYWGCIHPNFASDTPRPKAPNKPTVRVNGTAVTVSWNDVANEMSYNVYLVQAPWSWEDIKYSASVNANVTSYTFERVEAGTYNAFVIAMPNGAEVQSAWAEFSVASPKPSVSFIAWDNSNYTYIRETDAAIGQQIDVSGGTCTKTGMILYDNNRKELGRAENPSYTDHRVFFKVNDEVGITLSPGTTYQYRFWAAVNGEIYYSDYNSFKTSGTANIAVTGISVSKNTLSMKTGEKTSLTATVSPSNATDKTVTWSSSNTNVATVSGGKVTAIAAGTATITAKAGDKTATCTVTVTNATVEVSGISLNKSSLSLTTGENATLTATVSPSNATDKTVTWSCSNANIATVSNGKVTAIAAGTATITAKAGNKTATCTVTVSNAMVAVTGISLNKTTLTLNIGDTATLTATISPTNATDNNIIWTSDDEAVATVNNGVVTAVSAGTTIIRAQAGGKSQSCTVTVTGGEYLFEISAYVDGVTEANYGYYGMADIYINGMLSAPSCGFYSAFLPAGTTYEIKNVTPQDGYKFDGVYSGALKGTISNEPIYIILQFSRMGSTSGNLYLDQVGVTMMVGGGTVILNPSNGTSFLAGHVVTWSSNDPSVATVSEGVVTPVSAGTAIITASYQGATATCVVTVRDSQNRTDTDIPSSWATTEVSAAIVSGLVPEVLQKNYTKPVSRADVAQMFINLIEQSSGKSVDRLMNEKGVSINKDAFTDTSDYSVLAANALGIINGTGNGKFSPDGTFTRSQIAAIINRVARVLGVNTDGYTHSFTDVVGHWVDTELGWPSSVGIINGVGNNQFSPDTDLTTEQAIAITYRALQILK